MIGRLLESWMPPEHILDLRAKVRLRRTLSEQRGKCQHRIQSCSITTAVRRAAT